MKRSIKEQWINDLRSGNFQQSKEMLHRVKKNEDGTESHSFCCLGVLCEQAVAAGVVDRFQGIAWTNYGPPADSEYFPQRQAYYLPTAVKVWAGMDLYGAGDPHVEIDGKTCALSTHNDEDRTFEEIAQAIEDQIPVTDD